MTHISILLFIGITGMIATIFTCSSCKKKSRTKENYRSSKESSFQFSPRDITPKDDAFHGSAALNFTEWWYFDAALDNGYSVQMSVRLISTLKQNFLLAYSRLDIYKDGDLLSHKRKMYLKNDFHGSKEIPFVKLAGKQVLKGYIDEATGNWIYDLTFEIGDTSVDLKFIGSAKGFKGKIGIPINKKGTTKEGKWAVVLPRAKVTGKIKIKDKEINVNGIGYHDHNWDVKPSTVITYGWFWGKIFSKNYTMIWANVFKTKSLSSPLLVVAKINSGFANIKPEKIEFISKDVRREKGKLIPHSFTIDAHDENIKIHVDMKVLGIHHVRMMGIMNYWRYHVKCTGSITVDSEEETIDEVHMTEFLRFG